MTKLYYKILLFVVCALVTYGFVAPYLVSYPSDILSILGFIIGFGMIPVFGIWGFNIIKNQFKKL